MMYVLDLSPFPVEKCGRRKIHRCYESQILTKCYFHNKEVNTVWYTLQICYWRDI